LGAAVLVPPLRDAAAMNDDRFDDHYETLQVSPNADSEMIDRVYRLLAQRYHPDNTATGNLDRFTALRAAYDVLSHPERRAKYDVAYHGRRHERLKLVSSAGQLDNDFQLEQALRLTVLEALYTQRRIDPTNPGIFDLDLEALTGTSREHLEFTFWYLIHKGYVKRGDSSRLLITADGADFLEQNLPSSKVRRLRAVNED
jgi:curved DNA-binding protein